jgi:glutamate/tyrosine decarboxylase-like PLP-dependent enzyme
MRQLRLSPQDTPAGSHECLGCLPQSGAGLRAASVHTGKCRAKRGIELWASLRSLGREGLVELVDRTLPARATLRDATARRGHAVLNHVVINQVLVSFGTDDRTLAVVRCL